MNNLFLSPTAAWASPIYQQTAFIVLLVIFISGAINYSFRKKNHYSMVAWASNTWDDGRLLSLSDRIPARQIAGQGKV